METIYALSSGKGSGGIAVIRVSGPQALAGAQILSAKENIVPRRAEYVTLSMDGHVLDHAIILYFKGPASFTGEDIVEYHIHGGRAVIDGLLMALSRLQGYRLAEPGEFTKRAFENGKLDLTEAEAIADLIAAETEAQRTQALEQLSGSLSALYQGWSERLQKILAHQEADLEFPDEDMPTGLADKLQPVMAQLIAEISGHLDDNRRGERLRAGIRIAILGAPNAGKSSLLNALAQREAAIVSSTPGTTRDVIEVHLDLGGYPVILADTAGLRQTQDTIEAEGIRRARQTANAADIKIALFDGTASAQDPATLAEVDENTLVLSSKSDLAEAKENGNGYAVSVITNAGMKEFITALTKKVSEQFGKSTGPSLTRERHRTALQETLVLLERSRGAALPELAAEDIRLALRALGRITGRVHVEEILDAVFRDFCIGK